MTDGENQLENLLSRLHEQLQNVKTMEPAIRDRLQDALTDIRAALERSADDPAARAAPAHSFSDQLSDSVAHFEATHPTIAGTLQQLIDVLGQMGI